MHRATVVVRAPRPDDVPDILRLWEGLRQRSGRHGSLAPAPSAGRLVERLAEMATQQDVRGVVAELDGAVSGMATFSVRPASPMVATLVVQVDYLHVADAARGRGVARALLGAATTYAEERGAEHVTVTALPNEREANRFYARLGFTPLVLHRVAAVATLRRRLGLDHRPAGRRAGLVARRRSALRARLTHTPAGA